MGRPAASRRLLVLETAALVTLAVGLSAARSVLSFVATLSQGTIAQGRATLNGSRAPGHPWVDLGLQLVFIVGLLLPPTLALVLWLRDGEPLRRFGLRQDTWRRDAVIGLGAAAAVGSLGLTAYLVGHAAGIAVTVVPTSIPPVWWRIPVLVLSAVANALLEEVVLVAFLVRRLERLGSPPAPIALGSAALRGLYHLYQGFPGLLGNALMGWVFVRYFQRSGRLVPQIVAHATIDIVAFLGYLLLAGHVSWLPT